ncbi:hypothetical protein pEaSNUABM37_00135 [Erwinia phage pEa_SNUABM_37]|nr:hypothetical protein pEaSNUABM37_00135 [Erwinia phage pEa_SNUABM_37]QXO10605.1 hypothetical protein pEaSNUABM48_00135 [Erwinia phage pEa_SNUABM_48]
MDYLVYLKYLGAFFIMAGVVIAILTVVSLMNPRSPLPSPIPDELKDHVRLLLEEIRFELTIPYPTYNYQLMKSIPMKHRMRFMAKHLRKYIERHVLDYTTKCSYVSRSIWLRKSRVTVEIHDDQLAITVYGISNVIIHSLHFMPSEYAHATEYFKNKMC